MRAVVALGGNAVLPAGADDYETMRETVGRTCERVAALDARGYDVAVTHGNGPQVGNRLLEQAAADTPDLPLDVLVAETQAQLGELLQRGLDAELDRSAVTLVTQVVVDPDDPAFEDPDKPVGPWYTAEEARERPFDTREVGEGERPYRRVVPSPRPREAVEREEIASALGRDRPVICGGGGGVPVARTADGPEGVEAVVDKDHTSRLIADAVGAEELLFCTDVDRAYLDYGSDDPTPLGAVTAEEMREHLEAGEFGEGSMGPKVRACLEFLEAGGDRTVVTTPDRLLDAVDGEAGTRIE